MCDSHNLNVSPLCTLSADRGRAPGKWTDEVQSVYEDFSSRDYIRSLASPMRKMYGTDKMKKDEMLKTLTKVKQIYVQRSSNKMYS